MKTTNKTRRRYYALDYANGSNLWYPPRTDGQIPTSILNVFLSAKERDTWVAAGPKNKQDPGYRKSILSKDKRVKLNFRFDTVKYHHELLDSEFEYLFDLHNGVTFSDDSTLNAQLLDQSPYAGDPTKWGVNADRLHEKLKSITLYGHAVIIEAIKQYWAQN